MLHKPSKRELICMKPEDAMYASTTAPDYWKVTQEFNEYVHKLEQLGVEVIVTENDDNICPNNIFMRDIAAVIGEYIVVGNPAYDIRKPEVENFIQGLNNVKMPQQVIRLSTKTTLEGADVFVLPHKTIIVSVGNRTNIIAYNQLKAFFSRKGWTVNMIAAQPEGVPQHILGAKHIVSQDTLISRNHVNNSNIHSSFDNVIALTENDEVCDGYAMNVVTLGPNEIIMPSGNPVTKKLYESHGLIVHETPTREISKMAGSLACMTLPLERER